MTRTEKGEERRTVRQTPRPWAILYATELVSVRQVQQRGRGWSRGGGLLLLRVDVIT